MIPQAILNLSADEVGLLVWIVWAAIGYFESLAAGLSPTRRRIATLDVFVGIIGAVAGGYLSTQFIGDTPTQMFLLSVLSAVFFSGLCLWIVGVVVTRRDA